MAIIRFRAAHSKAFAVVALVFDGLIRNHAVLYFFADLFLLSANSLSALHRGRSAQASALLGELSSISRDKCHAHHQVSSGLVLSAVEAAPRLGMHMDCDNPIYQKLQTRYAALRNLSINIVLSQPSQYKCKINNEVMK